MTKQKIAFRYVSRCA